MKSTHSQQPRFWRIGIVDLLTLTAVVGFALVFYSLLRSLIPDPENRFDRRQFIVVAASLAMTMLSAVLGCSLALRVAFRQNPRLFTIGNASLIACIVCLLLSSAKLAFEQIYFAGIQRWSSSDPFFSQYWSEFPSFKNSLIYTLLNLPAFCAGAVIGACTLVRLTKTKEESNTIFDLCTIAVPALWIAIWLLQFLAYWLPIRWLVQSGTHW